MNPPSPLLKARRLIPIIHIALVNICVGTTQECHKHGIPILPKLGNQYGYRLTPYILFEMDEIIKRDSELTCTG